MHSIEQLFFLLFVFTIVAVIDFFFLIGSYGILFVLSLAGITENADHWHSSISDPRSLVLLWSMDRTCGKEKARCQKYTYHTRHRCYCFLCSISCTYRIRPMMNADNIKGYFACAG